MTITITGNLEADDTTRKYVQKVVGSLEKYLLKSQRDTAEATVDLKRVNRAHGNKYEASVTMKVGNKTLQATDSTLNVLAALDIVRKKLVIELKNDKLTRLPQSKNSV